MERPIVGQLLYRLDLSDPVIGRMLRAHVYADPPHITPALLAVKRIVAHQPRAPFGAVAFVSGGFDPVQTRADFLHLLSVTLQPTLLILLTDTLARSGGEMAALARVSGIAIASIPGALAAQEEYPALAAAAIRAYLARTGAELRT